MSTTYRHWTELIKPKKLEVEESTLTATYGRFHAEPFERGFGQTIGNSLRRILLSSLMGASIVAVRIKGILHEFSTVSGVTEDVADIILNLKEVRFRMNEGEAQTLKIDTKGPGVVQAKDIIAPAAVEILNPWPENRDALPRRQARDGDDPEDGTRVCAGGTQTRKRARRWTQFLSTRSSRLCTRSISR